MGIIEFVAFAAGFVMFSLLFGAAGGVVLWVIARWVKRDPRRLEAYRNIDRRYQRWYAEYEQGVMKTTTLLMTIFSAGAIASLTLGMYMMLEDMGEFGFISAPIATGICVFIMQYFVPNVIKHKSNVVIFALFVGFIMGLVNYNGSPTNNPGMIIAGIATLTPIFLLGEFSLWLYDQFGDEPNENKIEKLKNDHKLKHSLTEVEEDTAPTPVIQDAVLIRGKL
jgi:hypothetical protein